MRLPVAVAVIAAWSSAGSACVDDPASSVDGGGEAADADGTDGEPDDPDGGGDGCAAVPAALPAWLDGYQRDVVARLSGETDITPDVRLSDRATTNRRAIARDWLSGELDAIGLTAELDVYGNGINVFARLEPDRPPAGGAIEYVVLGAHFDSVPGSPGANDNATGVAAALATARWVTALECRSRGFIVAFFDEEELGLVGSHFFAARLVDEALAIDAVHTIDQMGWDADDDRLIELEKPDGELADLYAGVVDEAGLDIALVETATATTDHESFRERGFLAVGLTEGYVSGDTTPHYHLPGDAYDTVDFAYLASTTGLLNRVMARRLAP